MMNVHPLYPERSTIEIQIGEQVLPGWFTGRAAVWIGGPGPRIIGPFDTCHIAMIYQAEHCPGSAIFPFDNPEG